jgi:spore coat polysaccharide biosynthesis protein SpsF
MKHVVCIIQARMGSSRLPGKVLKDICGKPMLAWVVERVRQARTVDQVVVATTADVTDDLIAAYCQANHIDCYRGDVFDVLDRYYQAARAYHASVVVRVTADCPLIDPQLIDQAVKELMLRGLDFTANRLPPPFKRTYPIGLDVEAATMTALSEAWEKADQPHEREHVMPYLYSGPALYNTSVLNAEADYGSQRWTVDTPEDLEFMQRLTALLGCRMDFSWRDVLALVEAHPELSEINADVRHKFMNEIDERSLKKDKQ